MTDTPAAPGRVLVTGAAGFIGSHLVDRLLGLGHEVVGIDRRSPRSDRLARHNLQAALAHSRFTWAEVDLADADLEPLLDGAGCVFHLAAVPGVRASWGERFAAYVNANVLATQRLLNACERVGVPRLVHASSSSVYGPAPAPSKECDPTRPLSPYGVTKLAGEQLCLAHAVRPDTTVQVVALRYFTVYGPRQRPDMAISRLLAAALTGGRYPLFGDGTQRREFTFVDDVVTATVAVAEVTADAVTPAPAVINVGHATPIARPVKRLPRSSIYSASGRSGLVAAPVPVLCLSAAQVNLGTAAPSTGWGLRERLGLLVVEELTGEAFALHDEHNLAAVALREDVEAAQQHQPFIDDDDLLMEGVDLDDSRGHLPQLGHVLLRGGALLTGVAGVTHEYHNGDAPVYGVVEDRQDRLHSFGGPRCPDPDRSLRGA